MSHDVKSRLTYEWVSGCVLSKACEGQLAPDQRSTESGLRKPGLGTDVVEDSLIVPGKELYIFPLAGVMYGGEFSEECALLNEVVKIRGAARADDIVIAFVL